jgi:HTH-type transcriptional regulator, pleiotropic regulator of extracellular virulence genes
MLLLNTKAMGEEIKRLRKLNKMSQKQLAEGLCTQPTISGIEAGKVYPSIDILLLISIRLKVNLGYLFKILLNDTQNYIEETKEHIEELLKKKNYQEVFDLCQFEKKQNNTRYVSYTFDHFINWTYIISSYYLKNLTWKECIEKLKDLLNHSHLLFGHEFQDLKIRNSIAIIFAENELFEEALMEYKDMLAYKDFLTQHPKFHLKIHYNMSKLYFSMERYKESLFHSEEGITISRKNEDMSVLGQLYFQQGDCFEKMNKSYHEIKRSYQNSIIIFQLLKRENYIEMIRDQKAKYT